MKRGWVLAAAMLIVGCLPESPQGPDGFALGIRVENATDVDFDEITVRFPGQTEQYGALPTGGLSVYRGVGQAYGYAYVRIEFGAEESVLQPIDFVGESMLPPGWYTYRLKWLPDSSTRQLWLELVVDEAPE